MSSLEKKSDQLSVYTDNHKIIEQTYKQIQKDFGQYSVELKQMEAADTALESLFNCVQPEVKALVEHNYSKLVQILYRVDLEETLVSRALLEEDMSTALNQISVLIIHRELQKVLIRNQYSVGR